MFKKCELIINYQPNIFHILKSFQTHCNKASQTIRIPSRFKVAENAKCKERERERGGGGGELKFWELPYLVANTYGLNFIQIGGILIFRGQKPPIRGVTIIERS